MYKEILPGTAAWNQRGQDNDVSSCTDMSWSIDSIDFMNEKGWGANNLIYAQGNIPNRPQENRTHSATFS